MYLQTRIPLPPLFSKQSVQQTNQTHNNNTTTDNNVAIHRTNNHTVSIDQHTNTISDTTTRLTLQEWCKQRSAKYNTVQVLPLSDTVKRQLQSKDPTVRKQAEEFAVWLGHKEYKPTTVQQNIQTAEYVELNNKYNTLQQQVGQLSTQLQYYNKTHKLQQQQLQQYETRLHEQLRLHKEQINVDFSELQQENIELRNRINELHNNVNVRIDTVLNNSNAKHLIETVCSTLTNGINTLLNDGPHNTLVNVPSILPTQHNAQTVNNTVTSTTTENLQTVTQQNNVTTANEPTNTLQQTNDIRPDWLNAQTNELDTMTNKLHQKQYRSKRKANASQISDTQGYDFVERTDVYDMKQQASNNDVDCDIECDNTATIDEPVVDPFDDVKSTNETDNNSTTNNTIVDEPITASINNQANNSIKSKRSKHTTDQTVTPLAAVDQATDIFSFDSTRKDDVDTKPTKINPRKITKSKRERIYQDSDSDRMPSSGSDTEYVAKDNEINNLSDVQCEINPISITKSTRKRTKTRPFSPSEFGVTRRIKLKHTRKKQTTQQQAETTIKQDTNVTQNIEPQHTTYTSICNNNQVIEQSSTHSIIELD